MPAVTVSAKHSRILQDSRSCKMLNFTGPSQNLQDQIKFKHFIKKLVFLKHFWIFFIWSNKDTDMFKTSCISWIVQDIYTLKNTHFIKWIFSCHKITLSKKNWKKIQHWLKCIFNLRKSFKNITQVLSTACFFINCLLFFCPSTGLT